ncbi:MULTISPECIES: cystathionine beta-lyase [Bacillus]|jgi:cystathionine beta-lyase|uniref:cysteine-S-conjugate beta-lyase n=1 Tax=Bacillus licheniformis (strain ATCC 14580 / DSM 13 / JCM 2505 / CCUG 7422 / NBRC 12200 / NCIMB 9375 / NCTC 10341 / NRRL NRS-1264 / Gibson 46) TaxID=279010 RepID=Q65L68_BACLD|nr:MULTISPECIES: cystathionine beta-lyase [Bacillus]AAU22850.1 putative Cystathionine beta-lyase [Bacillus licheniformis DSM 13 = ATCC 14580]AAU40196.1 cystathionine beta-lyase MetC [Bacillus licheniformis DSM 13 = ATCC 14580]ARC71748.1 cystathionine beta-lyase MetC [Bacillus licheniformis]ARC72963.1 cystathionine beta-lyase MetC [Bacillus licheniformis]ARW42097.1 Cystathionine beta-lyase [Bacillus licheniformis]
MSHENWTLETKLVHNQNKTDGATGAVSVPIQHASTFHQDSFDKFGEYDYSRSGTPTRKALEDTIAELEGGTRGFAFSSGMAAISSAFLLLSKGDHVLVTKDVYGGTYRMITEVLSRFGIEHTFVDMTDLNEIALNIKENTKVIYLETPSNPTLGITDIRGVVKLAKAHGCLTFLDNTFMTPALQRPLELGVDIVLHSATKFLSGHSDVLSGLAVVKDKKLGEELYKLQNSFGAVLGVQDCWLVLRGLKTLQVRLEKASRTAQQLAEFFEKHPAVKQVYYPGLSSHPGASIHKHQANGAGAVLSFELEDAEAVKQVVENVSLPVFAVSLGAVESILSYPAKMSHAAMPKEERTKRGITDGLLRLSVGVENADDLQADFAQALEAVSGALARS